MRSTSKLAKGINYSAGSTSRSMKGISQLLASARELPRGRRIGGGGKADRVVDGVEAEVRTWARATVGAWA